MAEISTFLSLSVNISKTVADTATVTINDWQSHMGFPLTPRSMTLDDLGRILLEFCDISSVSDAITAKRMKIDT